ncbi:hypothetical protein J6590_073925 [Homalodisca vitripennis]|nr:hypothetical protein J6590_073925 [Homalodisca vitripennis]
MRDLEKAHVFVMSYIPIMLTHVIELAFLLQFTNVAQRIAKAFRMVNFRIREEITHNIIHGTVLCRVLSDVEYIQKRRNMFSKITKIKTLMNQYWMLCDAVHQANDFYCDQLMAVMFSSFFHVTIKSYFFFLLIRDGNVFASTTEAAWVLTHICYAVLLVNSSMEVTKSEDVFGKLVDKLADHINMTTTSPKIYTKKLNQKTDNLEQYQRLTCLRCT